MKNFDIEWALIDVKAWAAGQIDETGKAYPAHPISPVFAEKMYRLILLMEAEILKLEAEKGGSE